jgi:hypothetical protein
METNPSVLRSMLRAYELGRHLWPGRRDVGEQCGFVPAKLFACLVGE